MIRLALFDVGETLIHEHRPLPHVPDALRVLGGFQTSEGAPLFCGVVSNFKTPSPPATPAKIAALESEFAAILAETGLHEFFTPIERHVTTSTRAGVLKPDRRIFEFAVSRSGISAALKECLFVTEEESHLAACRGLGMSVLRFGGGSGLQPSFQDWRHAPLLIAEIIGGEQSDNVLAAADFYLQASQGLRGFEGTRSGRTLHGQAQQALPMTSPTLGPVSGVLVDVPVEVWLDLQADGDVADLGVGQPSDEAIEDCLGFVKSLLDNRQIALPGQSDAGTTHVLDVAPDGSRRLVRKRYSFM
ncbi:MAG: HAD family hydrolase [Planctomycetales bacterium]